MSDEKTGEEDRPAWKHDVKVGLEPLRDGVLRARESVLRSMEELRRQVERHRAAAAGLRRR